MKRGSERYQAGRLEAHLVEGERLLGGNGENGGEDGLVLDLLLAVQPADAVVDDGLLRLRGHLDARVSTLREEAGDYLGSMRLNISMVDSFRRMDIKRRSQENRTVRMGPCGMNVMGVDSLHGRSDRSESVWKKRLRAYAARKKSHIGCSWWT